MKSLLSLLLLFVAVTPLIGQVSQERQILVTPNAEHPQLAKDSGLGGRVTVYVTVDQAGNVVSVGDATGPDNVCSSVTRPDVLALREAARTAAATAKFAAGDTPVTIPLNFEFPSRASSPLREGEYSGPVNIAPKAEARTSPYGSDHFRVRPGPWDEERASLYCSEYAPT